MFPLSLGAVFVEIWVYAELPHENLGLYFVSLLVLISNNFFVVGGGNK